MVNLLSGMMAIAIDEFKFSIKRKTITSYIFFCIVFGLTLYGTYTQQYGPLQGELPELPINMDLEKGTAPLIDVAIFFITFSLSALQSAGADVSPDIVLPVDIGIALFIIAPILIGITSLSKLAARLGASTIAREREVKTMYLLAASPQPRVFIYLSKFKATIAAFLPMIILIFAGTVWIIDASFMPYIEAWQASVLKSHVLIASTVTAFFFASLGMLISTITRNEEGAVNRSGWTTRIAAALATLWVFLPVFYVAGENTVYVIESLTMISPITLDMIALYSGTMFNQYMLIQGVAGLLFLIVGLAIFVQQDVEY
jgi:ABC-type transport system involved in multi-copper enzyme maturation permease subunit